MRHVFISYTKKNKSIADQLCSMLERNGLTCWIAPRDIPPGYPWAETIVTAIGQSDVFITLVSAAAYRSAHMARELQGADASGVPILPIRVDEAPLQGDFQYFLGNSQWLDLQDRTPDQYENDVADAVRSLHARSVAAADKLSAEPAVSSIPSGTRARSTRRLGASDRPITDELGNTITTFVTVALKREKALAGFDLADSRTLFFGFRFLLYVSLASALLHIPAWSAQHIDFIHPAFMPSVVAEALIEQIALCFVLYLAITLFGATVDPQQLFCGFCLLSAYQLMSDVCLVPVQVRAIAAQNPDVEQFLQRIVAMGDQAPLGDLLVLLVAGTASVGLRIVPVLALFKAFHVTDQIGRRRAALSLVVAIALWSVSVFVFSQPFLATLYSTYRHQP